MKKTITSSIIVLLMLSLCKFTFAQDVKKSDYDIKKAEFYKQYQVYKYNLDRGIVIVKPQDPSGLFTLISCWHSNTMPMYYIVF